MQRKIKKSTAAFLLIAIGNLVVSFAAFFVLPPKFFYDSAIIIYDKYSEVGYFGSYPITILFYKLTGLKYLPFPVISLIQFPILMFLLYKIGIPSSFEKVNVRNILVYLGVFMVAIFISMPSKEFITFIYVSLIIFVVKSERFNFRESIFTTILLLIIFGLLYRPYFALIPVIGVGMYIVTLINFKNKTITTIFYGILIAIFLSLSYGILKGQHFSEISREVVNSSRNLPGDSNSAITSPLKPDTWYGEIVAIFYGFFTINIPINGLKHILSPQIIIFVIWQLLLFYILLIRFSKCLRQQNKYSYELLILLIIFSFFIVQGVFEPDLGSAVRHKIGIFPLIYFALYYEHFRKELQ